MNHPYDRLSIPGIQGKLIFTPCPGTKDSSLVDSLTTLKQAGASAVISLMPASELASNGAEDIGKQCQAQDMAWFHLPVADEQVPLEDFGQGWKACKQSILERLNAGQDIAIHCKGGSGRTGLIAARIMISSPI